MRCWCYWNDLFLTKYDPNVPNDLNLILNKPAKNSDAPSRANEMYRIGLLKKPLSTINSTAWDDLKKDKNVQSSLGFLSAFLYKAFLSTNQPTQILVKAISSLQAIFSICQSIKLEDIEISINSLIHGLDQIYPIDDKHDAIAWRRYTLSAAICEANFKEQNSNNLHNLKKYFQGKYNQNVELRFIATKSKNGAQSGTVLYKIANSNDVATAIDTDVSLDNIINQRASNFIIGNHKRPNSNGFYILAYRHCKDFLDFCYDIEKHDITTTGTSSFSALYDESRKGQILEFLTNITFTDKTATDTFKIKFGEIMNNIEMGVRETLSKLNNSSCININNNIKRNVIYYGAPGTGKSFEVKNVVGCSDFFRTTFHEDYDYSSFVGIYKPSSTSSTPYTYTAQVFLNAYLQAWNNYLAATVTSDSDRITKTPELVYLIIEELNRGNCSQIFGELFQLLDRNELGWSQYPIVADQDLSTFLISELGSNYSEYVKTISENAQLPKNKNSVPLCIPPNMILIATMNTSDQSLQHIDSAFQRRWDWIFVPINYDDADNFKVSINNNFYSWKSIIQNLNRIIYNVTRSPDKQIGNRFIKSYEKDQTDNKYIISEESFVNKVLFFIWNEIFKDLDDEPENIFCVNENEQIIFQDLFKYENGQIQIKSELVEDIVKSLLNNETGEDSENS